MTPNAMFIAASTLLPAVGVVAWAGQTMSRVEEDLRSLSVFERMHFEIALEAAEDSEAAR